MDLKRSFVNHLMLNSVTPTLKMLKSVTHKNPLPYPKEDLN